MIKSNAKKVSRRNFMHSLAGASLLLPAMISELAAETPRAVEDSNPLAPKQPHFPAKAKRIIFLYMSGGVSHVDTFDPKPRLIADDGKKYKDNYLSAPRWKFNRYAKCETEVSELFPHVGAMMDDICVIRSMKNDFPNHVQAVMGLHGGSVLFERPSFGSWVSYGLGTVNQNLPSFVVLAPEMPYGGTIPWGADFLPSCHEGIHVTPGGEPIPNITRLDSPEIQNLQLGLADFFNKHHAASREGDHALAARIKTYETAFGMQMEAPEAFDLSKETDATLALYGLERGSTKGFAWQCLVARRLAERGVRFIELIDVGTNQLVNWDAHADMQTHVPLAKNVDQAIAGLLKDLKGRGMLDDTLVVWSTEFGRRPGDTIPNLKGRTHHSNVYSSWVAGGGFKGGITYGESDDYGYAVAKDECHVHDFHATILNQMGLDHTRLTYRHAGRDYRLTDVSGRVIRDIVST
jgi:hypothetical protein